MYTVHLVLEWNWEEKFMLQQSCEECLHFVPSQFGLRRPFKEEQRNQTDDTWKLLWMGEDCFPHMHKWLLEVGIHQAGVTHHYKEWTFIANFINTNEYHSVITYTRQ